VTFFLFQCKSQDIKDGALPAPATVTDPTRSHRRSSHATDSGFKSHIFIQSVFFPSEGQRSHLVCACQRMQTRWNIC
jgi:hypothetical protein